MKPFLLVALCLTLFELAAHAQTPDGAVQTPAPAAPDAAPGLSPQAALKAAQDLVRVDELWSKPLEWNELGASTEDIIAHTKKALGTEAPVIEVRTKSSNRSTFTLKQGQLGPTLSSLATLLDAEVWVFPGRLVVASETALTPDERALVAQKSGGIWKKRRTQWDAVEQLTRATVFIAGSEVKERLAAKGEPVAVMDHEKFMNGISPYELAWNELSATTQQLLLELMKVHSQRYSRPQAPITFDAWLIVGFDDLNSQLVLQLQKPKTKEDGTPGRDYLVGWAPMKAQKAGDLPGVRRF